MAFENTIDIINQEIKDLNSLIEKFKKYNKIPQIDIDLALSKLRELYDLILMLEQSNKPNTITAPEIKTAEKQSEIKTVQEKPIEVKKTPTTDHTVKKKTLADTFEGQQSVNESIVSNKQKDVSSKIQSTSIEKIESAIGLNDKFLFIKELFQGDDKKFKNTVNELNQLGSHEAALNYLENFKWDLKNEIASHFMDIVKRKFNK